MAGPQVRRIRRRDINEEAWDAAVASDPTPLPYWLHWWLDAATDRSWEGLVVDDYRAVLALPRLRRLRVMPVYIRPPYTQQLGPYGQWTDEDVTALLRAVPNLPQIALPLRPSLSAAHVPEGYTTRRRINYVLDLSPDFPTVVRGFSKRMRSYVRKHSADTLQLADRREVVQLCQERLGGRGGVRDYHFARLDNLVRACMERHHGQLYQLLEDGELLCAGFYPEFNGRTFNAAAASTELGLQRRGMTRMLAQVMRQRSGVAGAAFDFEGSELPGVKEYFASFGGQDEGYLLAQRQWFGQP